MASSSFARLRRVVLDMRIAGEESELCWGEAPQALVARRVGTPLLAVIDGNPGLRAALRMQWPQLAIQRCTNHKLRNLLAKAPAHLREELAEDYRRMIYADSREGVYSAHAGFLRKWRLRCKAVWSVRWKKPARNCSLGSIRPAQEGSVVAATMRRPKTATHWSTRRLAKEVGLSPATVQRIWQKYGLQPHRLEQFKFSTDPQFEPMLADIAGLYLDPPKPALISCVDEKSQIQALNRTAPLLPPGPGIPAQMIDYQRNGTTSLFAALEVASGHRPAKACSDSRTPKSPLPRSKINGSHLKPFGRADRGRTPKQTNFRGGNRSHARRDPDVPARG
jgi:hypothetical protein